MVPLIWKIIYKYRREQNFTHLVIKYYINCIDGQSRGRAPRGRDESASLLVSKGRFLQGYKLFISKNSQENGAHKKKLSIFD